eukprot:UN04329
MLAREYATKSRSGDKKKKKKKKKNEQQIYPPVIISHHMLMGLKQKIKGDDEEKKGEIIKMSKSDPDSAIFMEDNEDDVRRKIKKGYCPPGVVEKNPILDYTKHLVFGKCETFEIEREAKNGGNKVFGSYQEVEDDFKNGKLHPQDLKKALAKEINKMIEPVRQHFKNDKKAKKLLAQVKKFRVTK